MILADTIEMMNSEDFKERFRAEYFQLKIRYQKLHDMVVPDVAESLVTHLRQIPRDTHRVTRIEQHHQCVAHPDFSQHIVRLKHGHSVDAQRILTRHLCHLPIPVHAGDAHMHQYRKKENVSERFHLVSKSHNRRQSYTFFSNPHHFCRKKNKDGSHKVTTMPLTYILIMAFVRDYLQIISIMLCRKRIFRYFCIRQRVKIPQITTRNKQRQRRPKKALCQSHLRNSHR